MQKSNKTQVAVNTVQCRDIIVRILNGQTTDVICLIYEMPKEKVMQIIKMYIPGFLNQIPE